MAALPRVDGTSPLDRPSLTGVSRPMVELPVASVRRNSWTRWLIPFALLAIVAAAGVYEFMRNPAASRRPSAENTAVAPTPAVVSQSTTSLPNPLENAKTESPASVDKSGAPIGSAATMNATTPSAVPAASTAPPSTAAAATSDATLLFTFKEKSWVEVKDGNGAAIFVQTGAAGTTQTLSGTPPLEVSIGNAAGVTLTYRGQPIDIAPFTRANIARLLLK